MPPGHDAWTVGNEACVFVDFGSGGRRWTLPTSSRMWSSFPLSPVTAFSILAMPSGRRDVDSRITAMSVRIGRKSPAISSRKPARFLRHAAKGIQRPRGEPKGGEKRAEHYAISPGIGPVM